MKKSRKQQEIDARIAADPIARLMERDDVDYSTDELPTAPRIEAAPFQKSHEAKYPTPVLDDLLTAGEISREQYERLRRENRVEM
jgi:hypothetical protein